MSFIAGLFFGGAFVAWLCGKKGLVGPDDSGECYGRIEDRA